MRTVRVLHLGFEDPAMPGAGGGSVRTHEINRRLVARGHEVHIVAPAPGRKHGTWSEVHEGQRCEPRQRAAIA